MRERVHVNRTMKDLVADLRNLSFRFSKSPQRPYTGLLKRGCAHYQKNRQMEAPPTGNIQKKGCDLHRLHPLQYPKKSSL